MSNDLPALAWDHHAAPIIHHVEFLGEGDFCACYLINQSHVLRLAKHATASAALGREIRLLPRLARHINIQIPRPEGAGVRLDTGERFVFYSFIPGTALEPVTWSALDEAARSELIRQMARFAARLHEFPVETARQCGLREMNPQHHLPEILRRAREAIAQRLGADVWRYYERLFAAYADRPELHAYAPALLHGDLSPGHFLADLSEGRLTGVIDFGDCIIGDRDWDLIFILEDYGKDALDHFLTCYAPQRARQAVMRVSLFQQLSNVEYCLSRLAENDAGAADEALATLVTQATDQAVI